MFERVEQASSSYLTQKDVDVFIAVFKASKSSTKPASLEMGRD